jgi:hypothetical protein
MEKVLIIKPFYGVEEGETRTVAKDVAQELYRLGYAEPFKEKATEVATKEEKLTKTNKRAK